MKLYSFLFGVGIIMVTYIITGHNIFWTGIIIMVIGFIAAMLDKDGNVKVNVVKKQYN